MTCPRCNNLTHSHTHHHCPVASLVFWSCPKYQRDINVISPAPWYIHDTLTQRMGPFSRRGTTRRARSWITWPWRFKVCAQRCRRCRPGRCTNGGSKDSKVTPAGWLVRNPLELIFQWLVYSGKSDHEIDDLWWFGDVSQFFQETSIGMMFKRHDWIVVMLCVNIMEDGGN